MTRENIDTKARRYLTEARITITHVDATTVTAQARGSDEVYEIRGSPSGWDCSCLAQRTCCHLRAVWLVTIRPRGMATA